MTGYDEQAAAGHEVADENPDVAFDGDERISAFWQAARGHVGFGKMDGIVGSVPLDVVPPPSFTFGEGAEADAAVLEVLAGTRTQSTTPRADYHEADDLPRIGDLAIVLDSAAEPRALIRTTEITVTDDAVAETYELIYPTRGATPAVD
jgi:hypothetical protein